MVSITKKVCKNLDEISDQLKKNSSKDELRSSATQEVNDSLSSLHQKLAELKASNAKTLSKFTESLEHAEEGLMQSFNQQVLDCLKNHERSVQELENIKLAEIAEKCDEKMASLVQCLESNLENM
jgi:hypothetical protein